MEDREVEDDGSDNDEGNQETPEDESLRVVTETRRLIRRVEAIHVRKPSAGGGTPQGSQVLLRSVRAESFT